MPPISQQGSRIALVTWTVISSILAVAMTIVAIYFYVDSSKVEERAKTQAAALSDVVTPDIIRNQADDLEKLRAARSDQTRGFDSSMKLLIVSMKQRDQLAKLIGSESDPYKAATALIERAKGSGAKLAEDNLQGAVNALAAEVDARRTEAANYKNDSDQSKKKVLEVQDAANKQILSVNESMKQLQDEKNAALDQVQKITKEQAQGFDNTAADLKKQLDAINEQLSQVNNQNADLNAQLKTKDTLISQLEERLGEKLVDPSKSLLRQPDGQIVRLYADNLCSIDLGSGDHVTKGLTFEVYDKALGIPAPAEGANEPALPVGKASIEVISVQPTYSFCRIRRLAHDAALSQGDIIANLVYDRHTKYNFVVHGSFDLNQTGKPNIADAEVIKRQVTQWGGKIMNEINVNTDFVVLGVEPAVPEEPPKDSGPLEQAQYQEALRASRDYARMKDTAQSLRRPILNQNQFLYFIGYYDEAKR